jgi:anti-anti-sigma factor
MVDVNAYRGDGISLIAVSGDLDEPAASRVEEALGGWQDGWSQLLIDLRRVDFVDPAGALALVRTCASARACGNEVGLVPGPAHVQRVFALTEAGAALEFLQRSSASDGAGVLGLDGAGAGRAGPACVQARETGAGTLFLLSGIAILPEAADR